jgi:alkanesulfonate monooxygenase SsuD/methylene tetrahydromethanopterin reductase-like flavin-dependent oxidoreductase (luciferase family)
LRRAFLDERAKHGLTIDGNFPLRRELLIANTREQAAQQARERSSLRYRTYQKWRLSGENTTAAAAPEEIDVDSQFILGSPDEIVDRLGALRDDLGMTDFMFKAHWPGLPHREAMKQVEWFGTDVIPKLR